MLNYNNSIEYRLPIVIHLFLAGGFFFSSLLAVNAQSGWTKGKGELFTKVGYLHFGSDNYYNLSGGSVTTARFRQQALGVYAEYGITDRLTALVDWPFLKTQGFETTENVWGTGDMKAGLKYALAKKIPISLSVFPELPIARGNKYAQNKTNSFERINLPTGDGELNVYSVLAISTSLNPLPAYVNLYGGYNFRTSYESIQLSDQLIEGLEVGYNLLAKAWLKMGLKVQQTLSHDNAAVSFVRGEGTEFTSVYGGVYYPLAGRWGIDANYFGYIDGPQARRNIYNGGTFTLGVVYEIKH